MALDLALQILLDATKARQDAKGFGDDLRSAGTAAEEAGQKARQAGQNMAGGMHGAEEGAKRAAQQMRSMESSVHNAHEATKGMTLAMRGLDDLMMGIGMGRGGQIGFLVRGVVDLVTALGRMAPVAAALAGVVGTVVIAFQAFKNVVDLLKGSIDAAASEEKLGIMIKDVVGNTKLANAEFEKLQEFAKSPVGAGLKFEDIVEGTRQLQLLTGQAEVSNEMLTTLAATAEVNKQSFTHVADQYGRVVNAIRENLPIRAQLLVQMQQEGLISKDTVAKIENDIKAHKDLKAAQADLAAGMNKNIETARELGGSYDNVVARLQRVVEMDIRAPLGGGFIKALEPMFTELANLIDQPGVKSGIEAFSHKMGVEMLAMFLEIKDKGFGQAFKDGWQNFVDWAGPKFEDAIKQGWKGFESWVQGEWSQSWLGRHLDWLGKILTTQFTLPTQLPAFGTAAVPPAQTSYAGTPAELAALQQAYQFGKAGSTVFGESTAKDLGVKIVDQGAKTAAQTAATNSLNTSMGAVQNVITSLTTAIQTLNGTIQANGPLGAYGAVTGPGGKIAFGPPVPGATPGVRAMQYGPVVGEFGTPQMFGPLGALKPTDIAVSIDLLDKYGMKLGDIVNVLDQNGKVLLANARIADTSWKAATTSAEKAYYAANKAELDRRSGTTGQIPTGGIETRTGPELGYAAIVKAGADYHAQAEKMMQDSKNAADSASKLGDSVEQVEKKIKDLGQQKALKAMDDEIKNATTDYETYGKQVQIINDRERRGQIDITEATKEKLDLNQKEIADLQSQIDKLQTMEAAVKKAYPDADVTKYDDDIKKLTEDMEKLKQEHADLAGGAGNLWIDVQAGINKTISSWGTLDEQVAKVSGSITQDLATGIGSGLTALVTGSGKAKDAFKSMLESMLNAIDNFIAQQAVQALFKLFSTAIGGVTGAAGGATTVLTSTGGTSYVNAFFQRGGQVYGAGGIDNVPAMLTSGEYVLTRNAAMAIGYNQLDAINKRFAAGGVVTGAPPAFRAGGSQTNVNVGLNYNAANAEDDQTSKARAVALQRVIQATIMKTLEREKRSGGILNQPRG